jgi:hypothetical protein
MGVGVEASSAAPPYTKALRQPAYGEYTEQPEVEAQHQRSEEETASDRLARRAQWPAFFVLALMEIAWLIGLAYAVHMYVLTPLLG